MGRLYSKTYILFFVILIAFSLSIPSYYIYKKSSEALIGGLSMDAKNISIIMASLIEQNRDDKSKRFW